MSGKLSPLPLRFGLPEEQEDFQARNSRFMEIFPRLHNRMCQVLLRTFISADPAQSVVFFLGQLVAEDFMEIFLSCANGYGMAGLKLLRPMFEAVVTALYLARHPDEAEAFLNYHFVHQRKTLKFAESVGVDLSDIVTKDQQAEIETTYQDQYRQVMCPECGAELRDMSWTKKDVVAMSRELGLQETSLNLYFSPTLQIHTTPTRIMARVEQTAEGLGFKVGAQRPEADAALVGAHGLVALVLEDQNRYFALGLADLENELNQDLEYAWQGRPKARIAPRRSEEPGGTKS